MELLIIYGLAISIGVLVTVTPIMNGDCNKHTDGDR